MAKHDTHKVDPLEQLTAAVDAALEAGVAYSVIRRLVEQHEWDRHAPEHK